MPPPDPSAFRRALLAWYDAAARELPWRVGPAARAAGARPDAYRVWLSEVMLQQTTTAHAAPYFLAFTARWPTVQALAAAREADVMAAWAGLGYYARARNMIACARAVAGEHGGVFPDAEAGLRALPGLGPYTAAAVAAIAFDRPAVVVDGNVERVTARLFAVETPLPDARPELRRLAAVLAPDTAEGRPGDFAQAMMDLGAGVCRPKAPLCLACPVASFCAGLSAGAPERLPRKRAKAARPRRHGVVFLAMRSGCVARVRRPDKGLLGGMAALPTVEWRADPYDAPETLAAAPARGDWCRVGEVEHVFTHFALTLQVWRAEVAADIAGATWVALERAGEGLPTVFRKALEASGATR